MTALFTYRVRYEDCTDIEPSPGWYYVIDDSPPVGPFASKDDARDAAEGK